MSKPKVKARTATRHFFTLGSTSANELVEKSRKEQYRTYDEAGRILHETIWSPADEGLVLEERTNTYNSAGKLIEERINHPADGYEEHRAFEVDENGLVQQAKQYYEDGSYDVIDYIYDEQNRIVSRKTTDSDGESDGHETWTYGEHNSVTKQYIDCFNEEEKVERFEYDANGNEILQEVTEFGVQTVFVQQTYDDKNRLETTTLKVDGGTVTITYKYGESGDVEEEHFHDEDGNMVQLAKLTYYDNGLLKEEDRTLMAGDSERKERRSYEYELF